MEARIGNSNKGLLTRAYGLLTEEAGHGPADPPMYRIFDDPVIAPKMPPNDAALRTASNCQVKSPTFFILKKLYHVLGRCSYYSIGVSTKGY